MLTHNLVNSRREERFVEIFVLCLFNEISAFQECLPPRTIPNYVAHLTRSFVPVPINHSHLYAIAPHLPYSVQTQHPPVLWYGWEGGTDDGSQVVGYLESCLLGHMMVHKLPAKLREHLASQPVLGHLVPLGWSHAAVAVERGEVSNAEEEKNEEVSGDQVLMNHIHG